MSDAPETTEVAHVTVVEEPWSADLADAEFARALKGSKTLTPVTHALIALALIGAGFVGGALVERAQQPATTVSTTAAAQAFRNANNNGGSGGNATIGTITLIDGTSVYVTTAQGDVVKVVTNPQTTISVAKNGTVADLDPSKTVVVQGTTNPDGTVTATQINQGNFAGLGGGRRTGGQGTNGTGTRSGAPGGD